MKFKNYFRNNKKYFIILFAAAGLLILNLAAKTVLNAHPDFCERVMVPLAKFISNILRRPVNYLQFSLTEVFAFLLVSTIIILFLIFIIQLIIEIANKIRKKTPKEDENPTPEPPAIKLFATLAVIIAVGFTFFNLAYGFTFSRPTIDQLLNLKKEERSAQELYDLSKTLAVKAKEERVLIAESGETMPAAFEFDYKTIRVSSAAAFAKLQEENPVFKGLIANPKPVYFSNVMSAMGVAGVYSPFFSESSISIDGIAASVPFTITHEISHGVMFWREDEANFVAFLACTGADDPFTRYSGYYRGFVYCSNALYYADSDLYKQLLTEIPKEIILDRAVEIEHYKKYEGIVQDVSEKFNDTFIKATGQKDGIKSYGNVVDLILAYYSQQKTEG